MPAKDLDGHFLLETSRTVPFTHVDIGVATTSTREICQLRNEAREVRY